MGSVFNKAMYIVTKLDKQSDRLKLSFHFMLFIELYLHYNLNAVRIKYCPIVFKLLFLMYIETQLEEQECGGVVC